MATTDKNIVITPNIGSSTDDPKIVFSAANSAVTASNITLRAYPTNSGTLSFEGSAGQLFSVTNSLSGSIFSVNDISGMPSIEVLDTGVIKLAQYNGSVGIGTSSPAFQLDVSGNIAGVVGARAQNLSTSTSATARFLVYNDVGTYGGVTLYSSTNATYPSGLSIYTTSTTGNIVFNNSAERVRIDAGGNLLVGTTTPTTYSNLTVGHSTPSTSTTSGALTVAGGIGVQGNLNVGSLAIPGIAHNFTCNISFYGAASASTAQTLAINSFGATTNSQLWMTANATQGATNGTTQVNDALIAFYQNAQNTGNLTLAGWSTVSGGTGLRFRTDINQITTPGQLIVANTTASTSTTSGALQVVGGVGIGGNLQVQGNLFVYPGGNVQITNTAPSTSTTSGALQVVGGMGIQGNLTTTGSWINAGTINVTGNIITGDATQFRTNVKSALSSIDISSGALVVTGGTGIQGNLNVYGNLALGNDFSIGPQNNHIIKGNIILSRGTADTASGFLNVASGNLSVAGNILSGGYNFGNPTGGTGTPGIAQVGVRPAYQYYSLNANLQLANGIGDMRIFNTNVFVAASTTYEFECMFDIYKNSTLGGTLSVLQFNLGAGTATGALTGLAGFSWINYQFWSANTPSPVTGGGSVTTNTVNAVNTGWANIAGNTSITISQPSTAAQHSWTTVKGTIVTSTAGWISPRVNYTVAPGGVSYVQGGSYMKLAAVGFGGAGSATGNVVIGSWA